MLVILGYFNAQIGTEAFLKNVSGKYTHHTETNDNGKIFIVSWQWKIILL
jgi:hypothetical protein